MNMKLLSQVVNLRTGWDTNWNVINTGKLGPKTLDMGEWKVIYTILGTIV